MIKTIGWLCLLFILFYIIGWCEVDRNKDRVELHFNTGKVEADFCHCWHGFVEGAKDFWKWLEKGKNV